MMEVYNRLKTIDPQEADTFFNNVVRTHDHNQGFNEETYQQAKPHFTAALRKFQEAGKSLKDLFAFMINNFGAGIKPYALRFAKDEKLSRKLGEQSPQEQPPSTKQNVKKPEKAFEVKNLQEFWKTAPNGTKIQIGEGPPAVKE